MVNSILLSSSIDDKSLDNAYLGVNKRYKLKKGTNKNRLKIHLDQAPNFEFLTINLASADKIRSWAQKALPTGHIVGEVLLADTFNYRSFKPEMGGLFCERIFGPIDDWECQCKRYICVSLPGKICEKCGVELTESRVRRHRMGFIELIHPVVHLWFLKGIPSYLSILSGFSLSFLEDLIYCRAHFADDEEEISEIKPDSDEAYLGSLDDFIKALDQDYESHKNLLVNNSNRFRTAPEFMEELSDSISANSLSSHVTQIRSLFQKNYSGVQFLKDFLTNIDLYPEILSERQRLRLCMRKSQISGLRSAKRIRILESFLFTKTDPTWMILTCIPVLPADLRPMMELTGGQLVSSDLNDLYRTLIHRNNRLCDILQLGLAPDIVIRNEKRMLQQAVDALIDNDKIEEQAFSQHNDRPLRSLTEVIEGKYGRFRHNLLGKRVDYSGRSVIIVGPGLRLNQCGLPFGILTELFKCEIADTLINLKIVKSIRLARILSKQPNRIMLKLLRFLLLGQSILLNRAPTLHRLGVQAFDPILVPGQAIQLHPLVCSAFNADFDGDQMGVHLPLSPSSKLEARYLMRSPYNILSPADGSPIFKPSQDMVIGCYYLTLENDFYSHVSRGHYFSSISEVIIAYNQKKLAIHVPIWVRLFVPLFDYEFVITYKSEFNIQVYEKFIFVQNKQIQFIFELDTYEPLSCYIRTTAGRIIFNDFLNDSLDSMRKNVC